MALGRLEGEADAVICCKIATSLLANVSGRMVSALSRSLFLGWTGVVESVNWFGFGIGHEPRRARCLRIAKHKISFGGKPLTLPQNHHGVDF